MARISIHDPRIRDLVDGKLVLLFLAERSTAALCKTLNLALGSDAGGIIHPNRLHALLSDDVSRGVNDATIGLVEQAIDTLTKDNEEWQQRAEKRLVELLAEIRHLREDRRLSSEDLIKRLGLPPAVARYILSAESPGAAISGAVGLAVRAEATGHSRNATPDWSYQDIAVTHSLEAFRQRPHSKVGLILPTGAGKTRTALRIVLEMLAKSSNHLGLVYWVTHRKNLRTQAHRELQKLLSNNRGTVPADAAALLAKRIRFVMVSELPVVLAEDAVPPVLVVVDEAHHAAAPSYQPIFNATYPVPALFLTATPNRADLLPIGIDEVAFTITYRELEERGCIVMPKFEPFPVQDFEWSESQVQDLADYVVDRCAGEFTKVLVLAPRIDRVEEFYEALLKAHSLAQGEGHPLDANDIGYIHGTGNSGHIDNDDFLDTFAEKPRAILVSAQLLLEGFDDPAINTVVLTYPTSSLVRLMQASGRCVRYSPGKTAAYVVQARKDELAYYFEQRWLYQEISDFLRPELIDIDYGSAGELEQQVSEVLARHNVSESARKRINSRISTIAPGATCRLLLYGLPYYGPPERFDEQATWGAFLEYPSNSTAFRGTFNSFSERGATLSDPSDFLTREGARFGVTKDVRPGSAWAELMEVLTASYFAREEIYGSNAMARASRPSKRHGPTTWLRYVTFHFRPSLPSELSDFVADCYNRQELVAAYLDDETRYALAVKIPLPLDGYEGWLLSAAEAKAFEICAADALTELREVPVPSQFGAVARFLASRDDRALPSRLFLHIEAFLGEARYATRVLRLPAYPTFIEGKTS
jgi:superfamily II DNA or RNA helicase